MMGTYDTRGGSPVSPNEPDPWIPETIEQAEEMCAQLDTKLANTSLWLVKCTEPAPFGRHRLLRWQEAAVVASSEAEAIALVREHFEHWFIRDEAQPTISTRKWGKTVFLTSGTAKP